MPDNPLALIEEMLETDRASAIRQWKAAEAQLRAIDARRAMARHLDELVVNMQSIGFAPRIDLVDEGRVIRLEVDVFAATSDDEGESDVVVEIVDLDAPDEASVETELDRPAAEAVAAPVPAAAPAADASDKASIASPFGNPWTAEQDAAVLRLRKQGASCEKIGLSINRSARAVSQRYVKLTERGAKSPVRSPSAAKEIPAGPPATAPETPSGSGAADGEGPGGRAAVPAPKVPPVAGGGTPSSPTSADSEDRTPVPVGYASLHEDQDELPVGDRPAWRRIKALGRGGTWSLDRDIALIEGLSVGRKLVPVADEIGVLPAAAKSRFQCLCPDPTMEEQARVLRLLRRLEAQQVTA